MSNVISVFSSITGSEVASVNTGETTIDEAIAQALGFREVNSAPYEVRAQLENDLRNAWNSPTDQVIRSANLAAIHVDRVEVKVKVTAEDAPAEVVEESAPTGLDVVVNSAVLNAPIAEFNTSSETLDSLKSGAMGFWEVKNSSVATQLGLIETAKEVLAATEGKTITNDHLSAVGIASVVVGDGGTAALVTVLEDNAAKAPVAEETPIHDTLVAEQCAKPVDAPVKLSEPVKVSEPVKFASEPKPVVKTVTKWRGLSNKVAAAIAVAAGVVGAVLGGTIF